MEGEPKEGDRIVRLDTFFEKCVYITIILFIFTMLFNVIMGLGIYTSITTPGGIQPGEDPNETIARVTTQADYPTGIVMDNIWDIVFLGGIGGVALAIATQSLAVIAAYVFGMFFWGSYINLLSILSVQNFLTGNMWGFVIIGTGVMIFLFVAALVGMFSGSG